MTVCGKCRFYNICKGRLNETVENCVRFKSVEQTSEEWFCSLPTEEKAEFLAKKCCEISCKFFLGEAEEIFSRYWIEWLKKPYQRGDTE